jgi:hypothetical protein
MMMHRLANFKFTEKTLAYMTGIMQNEIIKKLDMRCGLDTTG